MSRAAEIDRQRALLEALRSPTPDASPPGARTLGGQAAEASTGLRAYRANLQAVAQRSLLAAYPVLSRLLGAEAMAALARDLWRVDPPVKGDLAWFGSGMAQWLSTVEAFGELPYLPDVARLEWVVHRAQFAADPDATPPDLQALAGDPDTLLVRFSPGGALLVSPWPVFSIWQAHQASPDAEPDLSGARAAMAAGEGDIAWVWRRGLRVEAVALSAAEHGIHRRLLSGQPLGPALSATLGEHPDFSFEHWLTRALRDAWLAGFTAVSTDS
jgi:hypothetical protein